MDFDMNSWAILTIFLVSSFTCYYWMTGKNRFEELGIIHRKPIPLFGNQAPIMRCQKPMAMHFQDIYNLDKAAKYVGYFDFNRPVVMIRDPELIKIIAVKSFDHFVDRRALVDPEYDPFFGRMIFSQRGKRWREMRQVLTPAFTSSKIKTMFKLMSDCAISFSKYLAAKAERELLTIQSKDAFTRYTNDVIASCAFGIAVDSMRNPENELYMLGKKATDLEGPLGFKFFLFIQFPRLSKWLRLKLVEPDVESFFTALVKTTVEMRDREGITRPDMIQLMMDTRRNTNSDGPTFSLQDMISQAYGFFFGGFDTTSGLMCLVLHLVAEHPAVQARLQEEVDQVCENCDGDVTYEAISGMQYLDAVINETLRMYPVLSFPDRVCTQRFELPPALPGKKAIVLNPGDTVHFPIYALQRDPEYFPKPNEFYPERFIEDPKGTLNSPAYLPFGIGPRSCIGNRFALLETKILAFHMIAKVSMRPGKQMILPFQLNKKSGLMTPEGGFWLTLEPRSRDEQAHS